MVYVKYISPILIKGQQERTAKPSRSLLQVAHPHTHLENSFFPPFKEAEQAQHFPVMVAASYPKCVPD